MTVLCFQSFKWKTQLNRSSSLSTSRHLGIKIRANFFPNEFFFKSSILGMFYVSLNSYGYKDFQIKKDINKINDFILKETFASINYKFICPAFKTYFWLGKIVKLLFPKIISNFCY
jgi:hypothetical protein